jgi:hypothetical protein
MRLLLKENGGKNTYNIIIKKPPVLPSGSLTNHNIHLKPINQPFLSCVPFQAIIALSYT